MFVHEFQDTYFKFEMVSIMSQVYSTMQTKDLLLIRRTGSKKGALCGSPCKTAARNSFSLFLGAKTHCLSLSRVSLSLSVFFLLAWLLGL